MAERIGIIGVGAIGGVVGGLLTRAGYDVTLIDHWVDHVEAMKQNGLRLSGPLIGDIRVPVNALHLHEVQAIEEPFDLGFVSVKSYDTEWATSFISPLVRDDGAIVDFQNGINDERVAAIAGRDRTLGCVITIGCGMYDPGHCMRTDTRTQGFKVGELDGVKSDRAARIASIINHVAGAEATDNLWGERWGKLAVNCMANAVAGLSGYGSGEVRARDDTRWLCIRIAAEVIEVGRAHGHEIDGVWGIDAQRFVDVANGSRFHTARHRANRRRPGPRRRPPLAATRRDPRPPRRNRRPQWLGRRPRPGRRSPHPLQQRHHRGSPLLPRRRPPPRPRKSPISPRPARHRLSSDQPAPRAASANLGAPSDADTPPTPRLQIVG